MNRAGAAIALVALLGGCATPVPQVVISSPMPQHFVGARTGAAPAWPQSDWWQGFGDPQLTGLMAAAQAHNQDLRAAAARVLQAQAQTSLQRAALLPQLDGQAERIGAGCSGQACLQFGQVHAFDVNVGASYDLDVWGLAQNNLRAAREELKGARFARQAVALAVMANTANAYFNVLATRRRLAIAHADIDAIGGILTVIRVRAIAGAISHLDLAQEQAQLQAVQAQLPGLETTEQETLFTLAQLLGEPPEGFSVHGQDLDTLVQPAVGPGLPSQLLQRRPDVAQAEANLAAAHANVDAARAAFLPQIGLTGSGGLISTGLRTLLQGSNAGYSYAASLLETIFDGGRRRAQKALAVSVQREDVADYRGAVLNAFVDTEKALVEVAKTGEAQTHLRSEVDAAREAFSIAQLQYRQGAADLLRVLQTQQTLFSAEDQLAQVTLAHYEGLIHLYEALGGGWVEPAADRTQLAKG